MDIIDLTSSSPAIHAQTTAAARNRARMTAARTAARIQPRITTTNRVNTNRATATTSQLSVPQPRRQLRGRAAASSSLSNSLGTTPTTNGSLNRDSPGLFITEPDSDEDDEDDSDEYDSLEEYLQNFENFSSENSSSIGSEDSSEEGEGEGEDEDEDEDEDSGEETEPPTAPAATRARLHATSSLPAPSRTFATSQRSNPEPPPAEPLPQQTNLKRPYTETKMPSSSPAPKKTKTEPAEVVDMVDVDDDDDYQKIMHEKMIKTQREEGNARRKIADFKCVICLDDPENLSATSCGHLFCNECIKTTLRFGRPSAKFGKCPVCRGKVVIKEIVPLELKLIKRVEGKGKGKA